MGKVIFPIGILATLILAIMDSNPWKLIFTFMFVMLTIQAYKVDKEDPLPASKQESQEDVN